jgi:hypothetical protein
MTNFIVDVTPLPIDKINLNSLPPGSNPRQWIVATEWITAMQALLDVRDFLRAAPWFGLADNAGDPLPPGVVNYIWLKSDGTLWKTINGVATEIGSGGTGGGAFALPEQWSFQNVPASQTATVVPAAVSTEFDAIRMIRTGSIVGLMSRLSAAVSAGSITVSVTKNGVIQPSLNVLIAAGTAGQTTVAATTVPYIVGDLIGVVMTTTGTFAPTTSDLEAWIEVTESVAGGGGGGGASINHTEDVQAGSFALANNAVTQVLTCPAFTPDVGNTVQITGTVQVQLLANSFGNGPMPRVLLKQNGTELARWEVSPGTVPSGLAYNALVPLPFAWTLVADGALHVYSVDIETDAVSDGTWTVEDRSIFVNELGAGGSSNTIDVEDQSLALGTFDTINFLGAGVTATNAGGGVTNVTIPGGAGVTVAVIFDDAVPANEANIRAVRATNPSPIDNTRVGVTNLGSDNGGGGVGATANYSTIVGGLNNEASGIASTSCGELNAAQGLRSFAAGYSNVAGGIQSTVFGTDCSASAKSSLAHGVGAVARHESCDTLASGAFTAPAGVGQATTLVLRGTTPGAGAGESVVLRFGDAFDQDLVLQNDTSYTFVMTAIAQGTTPQQVQSFRQMFSVRVDNVGVATMAALGTAEQIGDAASVSWTLLGTVIAGPQFRLTFNTGSTTEATRVVAKLDFVEVYFP